jgi:hypothetical protein
VRNTNLKKEREQKHHTGHGEQQPFKNIYKGRISKKVNVLGGPSCSTLLLFSPPPASLYLWFISPLYANKVKEENQPKHVRPCEAADIKEHTHTHKRSEKKIKKKHKKYLNSSRTLKALPRHKTKIVRNGIMYVCKYIY